MEDIEQIIGKIDALEFQHRKIDTQLKVSNRDSSVDLLQYRRLKKRKLYLKDQINYLRSLLTPDIIA